VLNFNALIVLLQSCGLWGVDMTVFVAICDDDEMIISQIDTFLVETSKKLNIKFRVDDFITGEKLCESIEDGAHYDMIFLDIGLSKINGIEVGKAIREKHNNQLVSIVYISAEQSHSMQLFEIRPLDFLIKPLDARKLEQVVNTHLRLANFWSGVFTFKVRHDIYKVQIKDIMYLESMKKEIVLFKNDGNSYKFYGTMRRIYADMLKKYDFLPIHAAFLVNHNYVEIFEYDRLTLKNGKVLPISQTKRRAVRATLLGMEAKDRAQ